MVVDERYLCAAGAVHQVEVLIILRVDSLPAAALGETPGADGNPSLDAPAVGGGGGDLQNRGGSGATGSEAAKPGEGPGGAGGGGIGTILVNGVSAAAFEGCNCASPSVLDVPAV